LTTDSSVVKIPFGMAKGHTYFWRRPGRPDEEQKQFAALMRKVEAVRIRCGTTKTELAAGLGANVDGGPSLDDGTHDRQKGNGHVASTGAR
jgi:hypothetical protein